LAAQAGLEREGSNRAFATSMSSHPPPPLEVITRFEGTQAVLVLRGRVEHSSAFAFGAALDGTIDRHPESVVLDLSELEFIGTAGMVAVANAEKRLAGMGIQLTVRSPSVLVNRLLDMMESADPVYPGPVATSQATRPAEFRRFTAVPADPDVVDGALRLVVELARVLVDGADGVSVSLQRHGRLSTVAASDHTIMEMDTAQYSTGQGPCVDAATNGRYFHTASLAEETRWPAFTPKAHGLGINAILSSPLMAFAEPVGALNIYSRSTSAFDAKAQAAAAVFARKASVILSDAGAGVSDAQMAARFQEALRNRKDITLATGVLMERKGIGEEEAFADLLRVSLSHGEPLRDRAQVTVRSARRAEAGTERGSDD
jgi:anti-anti-sigma factor